MYSPTTGDYVLAEYREAEDKGIEVETEVETYATVPEPQLQAWQEAYLALLQQYYAELDALELYLYPEQRPLFTLHDINRDGIPELLIFEHVFSSIFFSYAAYTFIDGAVQRLEIDESFGGSAAGLSIFSPKDNTPSIIVRGGGEGFWRHMLISMEKYSLVVEVGATVNTLRYRGHDGVLYYVRGLEVTPAELPDSLYWLAEEKEWMNYRWGYVLVTEEEFNRVLDDVFGDMSEMERSWLSPITEFHISSAILNWE